MSFSNLTPEQVLEPESSGELAEMLRQAQHDQKRLLIAGGGTRLAYGNTGGPFDHVLLTRKLNRVIHYEPDDMTMAVEPGCTIAQVHDVLAEHGQFIALDVAHPERATIGGSYATGLSGPRRLGGGSLKDWVIGVEVAGTDGRIAKAGGMVVKNVTGFDMMHLHYGALGAFGVVTRLNLKVFPMPGASRSIALTYERASDAHAAAIALLRSQLQPAAILISNRNDWTVHVRLDAPPTAIERLTERVIEAAADVAVPDDAAVSHDGTEALEPFVHAVTLTGGRVVARMPLVPTRQIAIVEGAPTGDDLEICADIGSGLIYVTSTARQPIAELIEGHDIEPTWLALPAHLRRDTDVFGPMVVPAADVVRRLKDQFDPERLLNPGRFVLGL